MQNESFTQEIKKYTNHVDALLVLRGFACLMVVVSHCSPPIKSIIYRNHDLSWILFSHGALAVWIFFCLSGYLMGKAFFSGRYTADSKGTIHFWRNRFLRVCPLYFFALTIQIVLVYPEFLKGENWVFLVRAFSFTFAHNLPVQFNLPIWSISTEMQFYFIVPLIYALLKNHVKESRKVIGIAFVILISTFGIRGLFWLIFQKQIAESMTYYGVYLYTPLVTSIDVFLLGFLINPLVISFCSRTHAHKSLNSSLENALTSMDKYRSQNLAWTPKTPLISFGYLVYSFLNQTIKFLVSNRKIIAVFLIVLIYLFATHHYYHQEMRGGVRTAMTLFIWAPLTAIVVCLFIFAFEGFEGRYYQRHEPLSFNTILRNPLRIFETLGILSYGIYLWHMPVIHKITPIFTSELPIEAFYHRLVAVIVLSALISAMTYYAVELPAARWKRYQSPNKN